MNNEEQLSQFEVRKSSINNPVIYGNYLLLNGSAIIKFNQNSFETLGFPLC
jgi:hypothetical protein